MNRKKIKQIESFILNNKKPVAILGLATMVILVFLVILQGTNASPRGGAREEPLTSIGNLEVSLTDSDTIGDITLGSSVSRKLAVENKGDMPMFVRVMVFPTLTTDSNLVTHLTNPDVIKDLTTADWKDGGDGYYYYTKKIDAGKTSSNIFSQLTVPASKQKGKMTFSVKVESTVATGKEYRQAFWGTKDDPTDTTLKDIDTTLLAISKTITQTK